MAEASEVNRDWSGYLERQEWETFHHKGSMESTERLRVPGGWLYRTRIRNSNVLPDSFALTFVED